MARSDSMAADDLTTYLVEDRNGRVSAYGRGNSKIGPGIYTYSRLPGLMGGTCPGATAYCESVCYAKRVVDNVPVWDLWRRNSSEGLVPMPPLDAKVVRWHVSGDFDTREYIAQWRRIVHIRSDVRFFGYTRSCRAQPPPARSPFRSSENSRSTRRRVSPHRLQVPRRCTSQ